MEKTNPQKPRFSRVKGKHPEVLETPHHTAGWKNVYVLLLGPWK